MEQKGSKEDQMCIPNSSDWESTTLGISLEEEKERSGTGSFGYLSASTVPPNLPAWSAPSSKGKNVGNAIHNGTWEDLGMESIQ